MKKVYIMSNGCVPNRLEGKRISSFFMDAGSRIADNPELADIIILNLCGYSGDKIAECQSIIENVLSIRRANSEVFLTGCLDKISLTIKSRYPLIRIIEFSEFAKVFNSQCRMDNLYVSDNLIDILETTKKNIYNIVTSRGCLGVCSYCAIRKARGKIKSKAIEEILDEFRHGLALGYKKFILWADDLGAYGADIAGSYIDLLKSILEIKGHSDYQLFLHRLNPQWITTRFAAFLELLSSKKIRLIYVPIQSGSPRVLNLMRRSYNIEGVTRSFQEIKYQFPQILIKTDIMIGFPSETEHDFSLTLDIIKNVKFDEVAVFNYSGIPDTPAFSMNDQISEDVKNQRQQMLWDRFPSLRYNVELEKGSFWIIDKKDNIRVPIQMSAYSAIPK